MLRPVAIVAFALVSGFLLFPDSLAADSTVTLGVDTDTTGNSGGNVDTVEPCRSVAVDEEFTVDVFVQGVTDFVGGQTDLYYEAGVLEVTSIVSTMDWAGGEFLFEVLEGTPDQDGRSLWAAVWLGAGSGGDGEGALFRATMRALTPGVSPLTFYYTILLNLQGDVFDPVVVMGETVSNPDISPAVIFVGEPCPAADLNDADYDGVTDASDNCPSVHNPDQADKETNGVGDWCDDPDQDLILSVIDNCEGANSWYNNLEDLDGDGLGDICDPDRDGDGVPNGSDNAPSTYNPDQADSDSDGNPDVLDHDQDGDTKNDKGAVVSTSANLGGDGEAETVVKTMATLLGGMREADTDADGDPDLIEVHVEDVNGGLLSFDADGDGELEIIIKDPGQPPSVYQEYDMSSMDPDSDVDIIVVGGGPLGLIVPAPTDLDGDGEMETLIWEPEVPFAAPIDADLDGDSDVDVRWANAQSNAIDNCPGDGNTNQANFDGDAYGDVCDPDDDEDGFGDTEPVGGRASEAFLQTDPMGGCASTSTANDESGSDAWPVDFNDSQSANIVDVLQYIGKLNYASPNPLYNQRFDLSGDGAVNLVDVLKFIPFLNKCCA